MNARFNPREASTTTCLIEIERLKTELIILREVNAELVAALSGVTHCLAWHEKQHGVGMDRHFLDIARAALAKATQSNAI